MIGLFEIAEKILIKNPLVTAFAVVGLVTFVSYALSTIAVMVITPLVSKVIRIDTPREAIIFGGLLGTTSGTSAAMAAIDPALVPYAAMTSTFYTGLGCLVCPSVLYFAVAAIV